MRRRRRGMVQNGGVSFRSWIEDLVERPAASNAFLAHFEYHRTLLAKRKLNALIQQMLKYCSKFWRRTFCGVIRYPRAVL